MLLNRLLSARPSRKLHHRVFKFGSVLLLATLAHSQLAAPVDAHPKNERRKVAKPTNGWVCNAYGVAGGWQTITGSPKPTKAAALSSAMKDCQSSLFACRTTGCWPR